MKTIVFAYSEFGCVGIEEVLAAGYDIAAVYTYRDDPKENVFFRSVAKLCVEKNLPAFTLDDNNDAEALEQMEAIAPDFIFSFYYRSLLPDRILNLAKKGAFNIHGSLLPRYRGRAPVNWVLVKGEKQTGVTLHRMVARADAGDIVGQKKVEIAYEDNALSLQHKLVNTAREVLQEQLPLIAKGTETNTPQDISQGNYVGRRTPADGIIDWSQSGDSIRNLIRAVAIPFPGAFTYAGAKKLLVWDAGVEAGAPTKPPGTVLSLKPLAIACGDGAVIIKAGQQEDGLYLSGAQLAVDAGLSVGMTLSSAPA